MNELSRLKELAGLPEDDQDQERMDALDAQADHEMEMEKSLRTVLDSAGLEVRSPGHAFYFPGDGTVEVALEETADGIEVQKILAFAAYGVGRDFKVHSEGQFVKLSWTMDENFRVIGS